MSPIRGAALALLTAMTLIMGFAATPARADHGALFVVDGASLSVIPEKGTAARVIVRDPRVIRFSGDPYPIVRSISVRRMLEELHWSAITSKFPKRAPLASVSIAGQPSRVIALGKAEIRDGKLTLHGYAIDGPLAKADGPGSAFINNPAAYP